MNNENRLYKTLRLMYLQVTVIYNNYAEPRITHVRRFAVKIYRMGTQKTETCLLLHSKFLYSNNVFYYCA